MSDGIVDDGEGFVRSSHRAQPLCQTRGSDREHEILMTLRAQLTQGVTQELYPFLDAAAPYEKLPLQRQRLRVKPHQTSLPMRLIHYILDHPLRGTEVAAPKKDMAGDQQRIAAVDQWCFRGLGKRLPGGQQS